MRETILLAVLAACVAQAASAGEAECMFLMGGKNVLVGPCAATDRDPTGSVQISAPDGSTVARIESAGGGVGKAFWNQGTKGAEPLTEIGAVVLVGACWASDKTKLCVTR